VPLGPNRHGLALAVPLLLACAQADRHSGWERYTLPPGSWRLLASDRQTAVAVDTAAVRAAPNGQYRVRLLYRFTHPLVVDSARGVLIHVLLSDEVTSCDRHTAHAMSAEVYDTLGQFVGPVPRRANTPPPSMIGGAGRPLCAWLRESDWSMLHQPLHN
jgi:hypothetical protein